MYVIICNNKSSKDKHEVFKALEMYFPIILGDYMPSLKQTTIKFYNKHINWKRGYAWLINKKKTQLLIKIPVNYRKDTGWLIFHELCHIRQILDGKLKLNKKTLSYKYPSKKAFDSFSFDYGWQTSNGRKVLFPPWEEEVWELERMFLWERII